MPAKKNATTIANTVFQLKISLKGSKPPIWRRVQVLDTTSLAYLHLIIQYAMNWENYHLHVFTINGAAFSDPNTDVEDTDDENAVTLATLGLTPKMVFEYEYDFGDSWHHEILVEKVLPVKPTEYYPHCITGRRAGTPEDCGGIWGYADLLETIQDPTNPESADLREWLPEGFDPEKLDLDAINARLKMITPPSTTKRKNAGKKDRNLTAAAMFNSNDVETFSMQVDVVSEPKVSPAEQTERLRQAIMRYRELLTLMRQTIDTAEKAYAQLFAVLPIEDRTALKEKDQQWKVAAHLLAQPAAAGLGAFQAMVLSLRFDSRNFERDFEQLYDILSSL